MTELTATDARELFRSPPQRHVDVDTGEVAYRVVGSGPDLLFVHGWPVSGATFRGLLPHLAPHFRCHIIDLPGAGDSRFGPETPLSIENHIHAARRTLDALALEDVAVVGHDSGGLIARHAFAGDPRVRAFGLINTEQPQGLSWRFRLFLLPRNIPGFGALLGWAVGQPRLRRSKLLLGDAFVDHALIDGDFDQLFLRPIHEDRSRRDAAIRLLRSFDPRHVAELEALHRRIEVPVQLVWGERDPFFPVAWAREMVSTFPAARLHVVKDTALFVHEERPAEVARALMATLRPALQAPRQALPVGAPAMVPKPGG